MKLSPVQAAAAQRLGQDACVIAGPGSGKTRVLIERFSWLIREQQIRPHRILAITFTEKAATEIKQRLVARFADLPELREQLERAYVSTMHAFCARMLRENAIVAGVDPQFQVLDIGPTLALLQESADQVLEETYTTQPERTRRFLRSLAVGTEQSEFVPDLAQSLVQIYTAMRLAGVPIGEAALNDPDRAPLARIRELLREVLVEPVTLKTPKQREMHGKLNEWAGRFLSLPAEASREHFKLLSCDKFNKASMLQGSRAREAQDELRLLIDQSRAILLLDYYRDERRLIVETLAGIDQAYRARKRAISALDFDDLEECSIHLLQADPALRDRVRSSFDFILMDELQDTNRLQWRLMDLIRRPGRFFAVGDVNQSIFGFRHAEPRLFYEYRDNIARNGGAIDELRDNYRSRPQILGAVNRVFAGAAGGVEPHTLMAAGDFAAEPSAAVEVMGAFAETTDEAERKEALHIAQRISELVGTLQIGDRRAQYSDIAILTRTNARTGPVQQALDQFNIPSIVLGGKSFFETRETRDLLLLLAVLANPTDEIALAGFLRSPIGGLNDEDLFRLTATYKSLYEAVLMEPPACWSAIESARSVRDIVSPDQLIRRVLDDCDYESGLAGRARANIEKFLVMLRTRFTANPAPLSVLLREIEAAPPEAEAPPNDFGNAVRLLTIHKSKGLEFPIVFLPGLHTGSSRESPIIGYRHEHGLGVKWRDPASRKPEADAIHDRNCELSMALQAEEENRLLYVGMTRAEERLVLSFSKSKHTRGGSWAELVSKPLEFDPSAPTNAVVERNQAGIRVFLTDEMPQAHKLASTAAAAAHVEYVDAAQPSGQYDSAVSVTSVSVYAQCPRRYLLSRYIRWNADAGEPYPEADLEELPASGLTGADLGTQVHALLAGAVVRDASEEAVQLADRFHTSELGRNASKAKRIQRERSFLYAIHDVVLRGQIDLWFEHRGDLILVDYKTDRVQTPVDPAYVAAYQLQLQIYALAVERIAGRLPDRAYLYFLRPNHTFEVSLSPLELGAAREAVLAFRQAQESVDFPLRMGRHCLRCEHYKSLCPAGRETHLLVSLATG